MTTPLRIEALSNRRKSSADDSHQPATDTAYVALLSTGDQTQEMGDSDFSANLLMREFADHLHFEHQRDPDDTTQVLYSVHLKPTEATDSHQHIRRII